MKVICLLIIVLFACSNHASNSNQKFSYPTELAILIDASQSVKKEDFEKAVDIVRKIPNAFSMSESEVRIAVVLFGESSTIALNLTANGNDIAKLVAQRPPKPPPGTRTDLALTDVKEKVFKTARPNALRVIFLITDGYPTKPGHDRVSIPTLPSTELVAAELRADGAIIYVGYVGPNYKKYPKLAKHLDEGMAGDPSQVFPVDHYEQLAEKLFFHLPRHLACRFNQVCRFESNGQCSPMWWRPVTEYKCSNKEPDTFEHKCKDLDCTNECDKRWPWSDKSVCDSENGGKNVTVNRSGPKPVEVNAIVEHCPSAKYVVCPTVSTSSTTTTTPTTTTPTTTTPTTTTPTTTTPTTTTPTTTSPTTTTTTPTTTTTTTTPTTTTTTPTTTTPTTTTPTTTTPTTTTPRATTPTSTTYSTTTTSTTTTSVTTPTTTTSVTAPTTTPPVPMPVNHPIELVALIDGSSSIDGKDFQTAFDIVGWLPKSFVMSENAVRMAVILYSEKSNIILNLTTNATCVRLLKPFNGATPGTRTDLALQDAKKVLENSRPEALNVIFLITDGQATSAVKNKGAETTFEPTEKIATELRRDGVIIYVGFVGTYFDTFPEVETHIYKVAKDPSRVFKADNYEKLAERVRKELPQSIEQIFLNRMRLK